MELWKLFFNPLKYMMLADDDVVGGGEPKTIEDITNGKWDSDIEDQVDDMIWAELEEEDKKKSKSTDDDDDDIDDDDLEDDSNDDDDDSDDPDKDDTDDDDDDDESNSDDDEDDDDDDDDNDDDSDNSDDNDDDKSVDIINERTKKLAERYSLDTEQAKALAEADKAVAEKYGDDPLEIAHAFRSIQGSFTRLQQQAYAKQAEMSNPYRFEEDKVIITNPKDGKISELSKEDAVNRYKDKFKDDKDLEKMSDDEIYRELKRKNAEWNANQFKQRKDEMKKVASKVRQEITEKIPEELKPYEAEVKEILESIDEETLLMQDFNRAFPYYMVKGKHADELIKKAEEEAFERGRKNIRAIKKKGADASNKGSSGVKQTGYASLLTKQQRKEALDRFAEDGISDEKAYKYYAESEGISIKKKKKKK